MVGRREEQAAEKVAVKHWERTRMSRHIQFTGGGRNSTSPLESAFTLLELSIVLAIIALVVGGSAVIWNGYLKASETNVTVARMEAIEAALLGYSTVNGRIPCPSDLTLTSASGNYGVEAANAGSCYGGTPAANFKAASNATEGAVPVRTLKLPDEYLYDGWGRKFRYAVDPTYTAGGSLPVSASCGTSPAVNTSAITVNDAAGGARTSTAAYALISHGANGHGAYTSSGAVVKAGSANTQEQTNCHCDANGTATTYSPTYVERSTSVNSANASDSFDDLVSFKDAWQMQSPISSLSSATCTQYVYIADTANNRILKFDLAGNFIMGFGAGYNGVSGSIGGSGSGNGQLSYPNNVVVDSARNVWVLDALNSRVVEFDSAGHYVSKFSVPGIWNAGWASTSVAVDTTGHVWVADTGNQRVAEYDAATGSQIKTIAGLTRPSGVTIDSSGSLWILDFAGGCHIYQCAASVTNVSSCTTYGSCGSGPGKFGDGSGNAANYLWADTSGNVWVNDENTGYESKYNSSGYVSRFTGVDGSHWISPTGAAADSSGYIWVADLYNTALKKYSSGSTTPLLTITSAGASGGALNSPSYVYIGQ